MMRLVINNGVQQGRVLRLHSGVNRIGRSVENHLQVPDPSVSNTHCEVILSAAQLLVRDLNSTNGTFVDGEQVNEAEVRIGQFLQLGNLELRLEEPAPFADQTGISAPELSVEAPPTSHELPGGMPSCANHSDVEAVYRCQVCGQSLCGACVRTIQRVSGGVLIFCSLCAGACAPVVRPEQQAPPRKRSLLGRVKETLRLPMRRP